MKVLIAEDDLVTRTVLTRAAVKAGHEVTSVGNGRELVERFGRLRPDLVLVDWKMPVVDGIEAVRQIRELEGGPQAFIVLTTGVSDDAEASRAFDAGIDDYLLKPVSVSRLRVLLTLTEARVRRRRAPTDDHAGAGPTAVEMLELFGAVAAVDPSGRMGVTTRAFAHEPVRGHTLQDVLGIEVEALHAAANAGGLVRDASGRDWIVRSVARDGDPAGYVLTAAQAVAAKTG
jgi:CheY-like chemotaxis protein